ncbi:hypothetical protein Tco_0942893 [Tanacetum coccineum]
MASLDYRLNSLFTIKECSSCGSLYNKGYCCTPDSSQQPLRDCPKCGNPVEGPNCQGCTLWRKKLKEVWFTICHENGIFRDLLNTYESSDDDTNVVNAPREPFVVKQDPGENSSQSPPQINHNCCYECGASLDDIFCQRCTSIQAFLKEYDHIHPNEKCMALLLAEEIFLKIKQAIEEEQNQPEVMQELLLKLMNDLQILKGSQQEKKETAAQSFTPYWNFSMIDNEEARDNFLKDVCTFLRKFSRIPFGVTPKVILIAWESFGKIKDALIDEQYRQEDIQELMSKLLEDVRDNLVKSFQNILIVQAGIFTGDSLIIPTGMVIEFDEEEVDCYDHDISSDDDSYENIEYVEASPLNMEYDSLEEENEDQEEKEFDLEDIFSNPKMLFFGGLTSIAISNNSNNPLLELPEFESFHFDLDPSFPRTPPEPPDIENSLIIEIDVPVINNVGEINDDDSFTFASSLSGRLPSSGWILSICLNVLSHKFNERPDCDFLIPYTLSLRRHDSGLIQNFLKTLEFGVLSWSTRASLALLAILVLGKYAI